MKKNEKKNPANRDTAYLWEPWKLSKVKGRVLGPQGFNKDVYLVTKSSDVEFFTHEGHLIITRD